MINLINMKLLKIVIVIGFFISTFFPLFSGDSKGILLPYVLIEIGLFDYLFNGNIDFLEIGFLFIMLLIQLPILILIWTNKKVYFIIFPLLFLLGFIVLNFYDLNFKDWDKSLYSLIPFIIIWITTLWFNKKLIN